MSGMNHATKTLDVEHGLVTKALVFEVKDEAKGEVEAVIATFGEVDHDGDLTQPGFFGKQTDVPILWAHDWSQPPLGKGEVFEDGDVAKFRGRFNLNTTRGREAFEVVKFQGPAQEWSYGYGIKAGGEAQVPSEQRAEHGGARRILQPADGQPGVDVREVSGVLRGAGIGTHTVSAKGSSRLVDHVKTVQDSVAELSERVAEVDALRREKGQTIGEETKAALADLGETLDEIGGVMATATDEELETPPADETVDGPTDDELLALVATVNARLRGF